MCYHYEILHLLATIHVLFADFLLAEDDNRRKINDFKNKGVEHITLAATLALLKKNTSVDEAGHARQEQAAAADDTLACNAPDAADEIRRATDTIQLPAQVGEQPRPNPSCIAPAPEHETKAALDQLNASPMCERLVPLNSSVFGLVISYRVYHASFRFRFLYPRIKLSYSPPILLLLLQIHFPACY